jgi:hypothetical protein
VLAALTCTSFNLFKLLHHALNVVKHIQRAALTIMA